MPDRLPTSPGKSAGRGNDLSEDPEGHESGKPRDPDEINIIREKTFTPEFRDLVERVIHHDSSEPGALDAGALPEDPADDEVILGLHRLYYNTRNLLDNQDINTAFDPFDLAHGPGAGTITDSMREYIRDRMEELTFENFAVFRYDISQKCYLPAWSNLARYDAGSLMISLHDRLFKRILSSPDGVVIAGADIQNDPYLGKVFTAREGGTRSPAFFILLSDISGELSFEMAEAGREVVAPFLPSGLLMIELLDDAGNASPAPIAGLLRKRLSIPFYLADESGAGLLSFDNFEKLSNPYSIMEYFFNIFLLTPGSVGIRLKIHAGGDAAVLYIMKYIISKLSGALSSDSALIQASNNRLLILTHRSHVDRLRRVIDEYIGLFRGGLRVIEFRSEDFSDSASLIQEIILKD